MFELLHDFDLGKEHLFLRLRFEGHPLHGNDLARARLICHENCARGSANKYPICHFNFAILSLNFYFILVIF